MQEASDEGGAALRRYAWGQCNVAYSLRQWGGGVWFDTTDAGCEVGGPLAIHVRSMQRGVQPAAVRKEIS